MNFEPVLHLCGKSKLVMVVNIFDVCLYSACKNLAEYYWIYVFMAIGPEFYDVVSLTCSGVRLTLTPGALSNSFLSLCFF